jgi:hypothetical protein
VACPRPGCPETRSESLRTLNNHAPARAFARPAVMSALGALCAAVLSAQVPATDPLVLAKYDANRNGRLDPAELEKMEAENRPAAPASAVTPAAAAAGDAPILISPFEVQSDGRGYYASTTMSGTRLNSKASRISALPSPS